MNYEEEQELEVEALTSIFEEGKEFIRVSPTEFKLKLLPNPAGEGENHVSVTLHVTYTSEYPEIAPDWELEDVKLPDEKLEELKAKITETIESSLGMAMIYTVAEATQDYLKENNEKELSMHEQMMKRQAASASPEKEEEEEGDDDDEGEEEEEEWKGLAEKSLCPESERITPDIFNAWRVKFDEEMIAAGVLRGRDGSTAKTGKQIFMEVGPSAGAAGEKKEEGKEGDAPMVYNAALFGEVDDEDLDDLSGGDD